MTDTDYSHKLDELERLLNDPDVRMEPARVWTILDELARHHEKDAHDVAGLPGPPIVSSVGPTPPTTR